MDAAEIASRLERISRRLRHWKYPDVPQWMRDEIRDCPQIFSTAAAMLRNHAATEESRNMPNRLATALNLYAAATGITQKELAEQWECSEATASRFLRGQNVPDAATCIRIVAWAFGDEPSLATITRIAGPKIAADIVRGLKIGRDEFENDVRSEGTA